MRLMAALFVVASAGAAGASPTGVYTEDISSKARPCADFFEFANGAWRENNPIPASMVRWSRRWASGELAKDQLKVILDEVSAKKDVARGQRRAARRRLTTPPAWTRRRSNALGAKPIEPMLAEIDALKDMAGVQRTIVPPPRAEHRRPVRAARRRPTTTSRAR